MKEDEYMCKHKIKHCKLCGSCVMDCKQFYNVDKCVYFKKGYTTKEYWKFIKEQNLNLKKICNLYGVSYNIMMLMLRDRMEMTYKYRSVLNSNIFELDEYIPYMEIDYA